MTAMTVPISAGQDVRGTVPADDLVRRLCSALPASTAGPFVAAFVALISFGLLPLFIWPTRWAGYVDVERADLLDLISRWRSRVAPSDARKLDRIARQFRPRPMLMVLPWLVSGFAGVLMIALLCQGDSLRDISQLTFGHNERVRLAEYWTAGDRDANDIAVAGFNIDHFHWQLRKHLYQVWLGGFIFAYCLHWYSVRSHASAVDSLVNWTNRLASTNGLPTVQNDSRNTGLKFFWIILAIGLCASGAWWGIPMVLAGAMQRRYCRYSSIRVRTALGCQLRDGFVLAGPQSAVSRFCSGQHCGVRLPAAMWFACRFLTGPPRVSLHSMQTIYIYLSEAGWAWFGVVAIAMGIAFALGWRPKESPEIPEADQRHEQ
jgi:hypothetical protein